MNRIFEGPRRVLKLLFFNHNVAWSGTFFRAFQLGRALVERGHQVSMVTTSRTARLAMRRSERDGVELIEAPDLLWGRGRTGWDPWNVLHRTIGMRASDFNLVHAFDCRPAVILPALYHARRGDLPLFVDWADWWGRGGSIGEREGWLVNRLIGGVETWFEEAFRRHGVGTTVISRALQTRAEALGIERQRILRFPNGCDVGHLKPQSRAAARDRLGLAAEVPLVLHLGIVYPGDLQLLLATMRLVLEESSETRLVMLGNPGARIPTGILPAGAMIQPGFVSFDLFQTWLAAADVCVVPLRDTVSGRGRWPGKINDYFCAARPVVMPRVGDAAEWIEAADAGWTCEPNAASFAAALVRPLTVRSDADGAGQRARELAETDLNWTAIARRVEAFYQEIIPQSDLRLPVRKA